jgi:hypothetical protein
MQGAGRAPRGWSVTVSPCAVALVSLAGAWLAHGLEYLRVWGWDNFASSASRQVHTYLGPLGAPRIGRRSL